MCHVISIRNKLVFKKTFIILNHHNYILHFVWLTFTGEKLQKQNTL